MKVLLETILVDYQNSDTMLYFPATQLKELSLSQRSCLLSFPIYVLLTRYLAEVADLLESDRLCHEHYCYDLKLATPGLATMHFNAHTTPPTVFSLWESDSFSCCSKTCQSCEKSC